VTVSTDSLQITVQWKWLIGTDHYYFKGVFYDSQSRDLSFFFPLSNICC
jgi:hypothetical protein